MNNFNPDSEATALAKTGRRAFIKASSFTSALAVAPSVLVGLITTAGAARGDGTTSSTTGPGTTLNYVQIGEKRSSSLSRSGTFSSIFNSLSSGTPVYEIGDQSFVTCDKWEYTGSMTPTPPSDVSFSGPFTLTHIWLEEYQVPGPPEE